MKKQNDEVNIKDLVHIFLPKIWIIVLCAVALSAILGAYAMFLKKDTYTAKATLTLSKEGATNTNHSDLELYTDLIEVLADKANSDAFLNGVIKDIKVANPDENFDYLTASYLKGAISISANKTPTSFTLAVTTESPERSLVLAKELVNTLAGDRPEKVIDGEVYEYYSPFDGKLGDTEAIRGINPQSATKNSKGILTNALIGFVAGTVVSMAVIYVINVFDVTIHDRKKIEEHFDIPVLGVIPRYDVPADASEAEEERRDEV